MYVTKRPQHLDVAELRDAGGQPKRERVTQWEHNQTPECYKPRPSGTRMSPLRKEPQEKRSGGGAGAPPAQSPVGRLLRESHVSTAWLPGKGGGGRADAGSKQLQGKAHELNSKSS